MKKVQLYHLGVFLILCFYGGMIALGIYVENGLDFVLGCAALIFGSALGLLARRPWAARAMVASAGLGGLAGVVEFFREGYNFDPLLVAFTALSFILAAIYRLPFIQQFAGFPWSKSLYTILLIDDDKTLLQLLYTNFSKQGFFVITAETGEKGLNQTQKHRPDLILLDVILPGIKGRTVCSRLKENPRTKHIPILFLTAKDSPDDVQAELAAGAIGHITKPVDFKNLLEEVRKILK